MVSSKKNKLSYDFTDSIADTRIASSRITNDQPRKQGSTVVISNRGYKTRVIDIWALGITIVIGGQYFNWNDGLSAGFGSYSVATLLIAIAYICLCFCTSELSSALPFAGGGYGLARVTLGFYAGFMVGCCEIMEYIIYTADTFLSLGSLVIQLTGINRKFSPLIWLAFYVSAVSVYCIGGKLFWRVSNVLAFLSVTILLIYITGSVKFLDFRFAKEVGYGFVEVNSVSQMLVGNDTVSVNNYSVDVINNTWFIGGGTEFMRILPLAAWMYVGIESLNFASNDIAEPKRTIPMSVMLCISVLVLTSVAVVFISSSLPASRVPLAKEPTPLNKGFMLMFGINDSAATLLSIPATYATAFGFIFSYGRLMLAMSESRLLPRVLRIKWGDARTGTPSLAFIIGSIIGYVVCVFVYFFPSIQNHLFNICILCAFGAYTSQFVGFINLRTRFADLPRLYRSPLGIMGAALGITIFALAAVSVIAFQKDGYTALISVVSIALLNTAYYFYIAKHQQKFSRDELKTLFNAHVFKLAAMSNKSRLERVKKSAKRTHKRSYDSDRNSYSGEQGDYKRNSSESLNAAMRSVVQRDKRDNKSLEKVDEGDSENLDYDFASVSAGTVQAGSTDHGGGPLLDNMIGSNDNLVTPSLREMAAKSMPKILMAGARMNMNRKVVVDIAPLQLDDIEPPGPGADDVILAHTSLRRGAS